MVQSITRNKLYLAVLLIIFIASLFIFHTNKPLIEELDTCWQYSTNYALTHHLNFGHDIIFTYGPLGFIGYSISDGLNIGLFLLGWLIRLSFLFYFIAFLREFVIEMTINASKDIAIFAKYILLPFAVYKLAQMDYNLFIFICLIHSGTVIILNTDNILPVGLFTRCKLALNIFTGATVSLLFFIKVSFLPFIVVVPAMVIFKLVFYKEYKNIVGFVGALVFTFILIWAFVNVNVKDYIINSIPIITGYKAAMQIGTYDNFHASYRLSVFFILLYFIQFYFIRKYLKNINLAALPVVILGIYFLFIYSYTRGGIEGGYIYGTPVVVLFFYLITYVIPDVKWKTRFFNINILMLLVCTLTYITTDALYLGTLFSKSKEKFVATKLPAQYINRAETYDIYPWNTSYCYFNHLNYKPRPIFQTYSCYTSKLDSINSVFFAQRKVDNIVFHGSKSNLLWTNAIDNRYFIYEEPQTKLEILKNYAVNHQINDSLFIASKREKAVPLNLKLVSSFNLKLGATYNPESDTIKNTLYYFTADFNYTTATQIASLVKRLPYMKMDIVLRSGNRHTFNLVSDLLKRPCILNKYCASYNDFFNLIDPAKNNPENYIKSIKFYPSEPGGYQNNFKMKIYELEKGL